jgi:hypothetical protein
MEYIDGGEWNNGKLEYWNFGLLGSNYSIIPLFHYSSLLNP